MTRPNTSLTQYLRIAARYLIPLLSLLYIALYFVDDYTFVQISLEDGFLEWATFCFFVLSGLLSAVMVLRVRQQDGYWHWFFTAFALACFVIALEEISWGQRLFGLESPEFFVENSDQEEINAHNVLQQWLNFRTKDIAGLGLLFFGAILPLLARIRWIADLLARFKIVVPPLWLSLNFVIAAAWMIDIPTGQEEEYGEFFFSLAFFFFLSFQHRQFTEPATSRAPISTLKSPISTLHWLLIPIILLAAGLRWYAIDLTRYTYEEARLVRLAQELATNLDVNRLLSFDTPLGIPASSFNAWLLAIPLAVTAGNVQAAIWWVGLLGVLAVILTCFLGRAIGGWQVGTVAALYMAVNPWVVYDDRRLWLHVQAVLSVALLWLAWQVIVEKRAYAAFLFPILAALQILSHPLALIQLLSWVAAFAVAPRRWLRKSTVAGVIIAAVPIAFYIRALAGTSAFDTLPAAFTLARISQILRPETWFHWGRLLTGMGMSTLVGLPDEYSFWWRLLDALRTFIILIMAAGVLRLIVRMRTAAHDRGPRLLLAWVAGPLLVLGLQLVTVFPEYWAILLPLPALYFALGWDGMGKLLRAIAPLPRFWRTTGALTGILLLAAWLGSYGMLASIVNGGDNAQYGTTLRAWAGLWSDVADAAAQIGTDEVRIGTVLDETGYSTEQVVFSTLTNRLLTPRFVAPTSPPALLLTDARPSLYLWTVDAPETEALLTQAGKQIWQQNFAPERNAARLYQLPPANDLDIDFVALTPAPQFDVGLELMGYHFPPGAQVDQTRQVTLLWRVTDPAPDVGARDVTAFNHILLPDGQMATQVDGLALASQDWQAGDVLVQPYHVQLPAGDYRWRVGLYSRVDGGRSAVSTGGDFVDIAGLVVE